MKKMVYCRPLLIGLAAFMMFGSGCSLSLTKESMPEDTLEEFEDAVNDMDVQGMMDCMDEDTVSALTSGMDIMMKIVGAATGVDLDISAEDLLNVMPLFQPLISDQMKADGAPEVDFQMTETRIKGDKATVFFDEVNSGESSVINMEKDDGKWYMVLDTRVIDRDEADRVITPGEEEESDDEYAEFSILDLLSQKKIEEFLKAILE
ncbi:MAG: hypothetical protein LUE86_02890 [Clostridiales bacterium]|nr:hypothetical protein [Clostridiales bacterium]